MEQIWRESDHQRRFEIQTHSLDNRVVQKSLQVERMISTVEWGMGIIVLFSGLFMIVEGITDKEWYQLPGGLMLMLTTAYVAWDRKQRLRYKIPSNESVLGELKQALASLKYHIRRQRNFFWWFIMPFAASISIQAFFTYQSKPIWVWLMVIAAFALGYRIVRQEVRHKLLPQREELEKLVDLLEE